MSCSNVVLTRGYCLVKAANKYNTWYKADNQTGLVSIHFMHSKFGIDRTKSWSWQK